MLVNTCVEFFHLRGPFEVSKVGKRGKGDKAYKLAAASNDLLHFKPELRPNC